VAPSFLSQASWLATSQSATVLILLAAGQAFVIITGGIDLSVGAVLACSSVVGGVLMRSMVTDGRSGVFTIAIGFGSALAVGATAGLLNGLVITKLNITPFIATRGCSALPPAVTNLVSNGTEVGGLPNQLGTIGNQAMLGGWVTTPVIVTAVVVTLAALVLARTRFGLRTYAIGSNSGAARRAGIGIQWHLLRIYVLSGTLAALAGILLMSRFVGASPLAGQNSELASIAAAVIGGASLTGGRGSIFGAVIGAAITAVLQIGLILAGVASFWQTLVIGIVIVIAVYGDQLRMRLSIAECRTSDPVPHLTPPKAHHLARQSLAAERTHHAHLNLHWTPFPLAQRHRGNLALGASLTACGATVAGSANASGKTIYMVPGLTTHPAYRTMYCGARRRRRSSASRSTTRAQAPGTRHSRFPSSSPCVQRLPERFC
jgi:ribose transport system permease protein